MKGRYLDFMICLLKNKLIIWNRAIWKRPCVLNFFWRSTPAGFSSVRHNWIKFNSAYLFFFFFIFYSTSDLNGAFLTTWNASSLPETPWKIDGCLSEDRQTKRLSFIDKKGNRVSGSWAGWGKGPCVCGKQGRSPLSARDPHLPFGVVKPLSLPSLLANTPYISKSLLI